MEKWQDPIIFATWLGIIILVFIFLVVSIIVFTRLYFKRIILEQKKLNEAERSHQEALLLNSVLAQEKERTRIAGELHDGLISKLNVVTMAFRTKSKQIDPQLLLEESIRDARNLSHELFPPFFAERSLIDLVEEFITPLREVYMINFSSVDTTQEYRPETDVKLQIFRILQEVINNIVKHANASKIEISIRNGSKKMSILIADNGKGFNTTQKGKGLGIMNIELRSQILKSRFKFKSTEKKGTTFIFCLTH